MGTDHLGELANPQQALDVLNEAVRLGINVFDTAPIYVNGIEQTLGKFLASFPGNSLYTITKGGFPFDLGPGTYSSRLKSTVGQIRENVLEEVTGSKSRITTEISLYLMHRDDFDSKDYMLLNRTQTPVDTILEALSDPSISKNFVNLGVSNWHTDRVMVSQNSSRLLRPIANSPYFSLMEMGNTSIHIGGVQVFHEEMMNPDFQKGVKIMTYSPLAGFTLFSRGWDLAKQAAYDLSMNGDRYWRNVYPSIFHSQNEMRYKRAELFTSRYNQEHSTSYTLDQIVNAYALAHPRMDFLIIGARSVEALHRTVDVLNIYKNFTRQDLDFLYYN